MSDSEDIDFGFEYAPPPTTNFQYTLEALATPRVARTTTYERTKQILDSVTPAVILEEISQGSIPVALSHAYDVPHLAFKRWLKEHVDPADMDTAIKACADSLIHQAQVALSRPYKEKHELTQQANYAKQLVMMAERLNSGTWGIPMKATPPPPTVQITIGGGESRPTHTLQDLNELHQNQHENQRVFTSIPGLEALNAR